MGFRFRKSINLGGGFRVNMSKSGIGYSWGVPGYRVTKTAKGRTRKTYSIPGTGLSYVEESGNQQHHRGNNNSSSVYTNQEPIMKDIASAGIENYKPAEYKDFISSIEKVLLINKISSWFCFTFLLAATPIFILTGIFGLLLKVYVRTMGKISIDYELDEYSLDRHNRTMSAWKILNNSSSLWQVLQSGDVMNRKIHAGASSLVNRKDFKIIDKVPFYLKTDVKIMLITLNKESLIFLPDKVLIIKGGKIGAISYKDINFDIGSTQFIESSKVPKDALIIDYTWAKVNKNGTPDKRFKDNRQLPICKYGEINIFSNSGLNIVLQCSNLQNTSKFEDLILNI
ncbi:MAG: DUF4236 domain-containing protein [Tissierella sp.]|nr:DUF4236 domain-containing protein [Tissierella sp.]